MGGNNKKYSAKPKGNYEDKPENYKEDFGIKLSMWYFEQCDPKKCSGMMLKNRGYLTTLKLNAKFNGVVLTPSAKKIISPEDKDLILECGVAVIDCSWAYFDSVKVKSIKANERLLPLCLAANPVNYGKEIRVNCAEALAGALYLSGFQDQAQEIMDIFKYGNAFFAINEFHFSHYEKCNTSDEMFAAQDVVREELAKIKEETKNQAIDYGDGSSENSEDSAEEREYYAKIN
jgi:pre-rRNA-processing protein TSR3